MTLTAVPTTPADGSGTLLGTVVNPAGLTLAKTVPISRAPTFVDPGMGASPTWHGFAIDQTGIAFTDAISVVGDHRVRIDPTAARPLDDGLDWAPGSFYDQDGAPVPECARGVLGRVEARLAAAGLRALVGHEIEFLLVAPDGSRLPGALWAQYGLAGVLEHEQFVRDVLAAADTSGVEIEQFHPEYGVNQFEISLAPLAPIAAADQLVLMRIIVSRVARRSGLRVSLSPVPFAGGAGNGAHQHFSLLRGGVPIFSGGSGAHGMTPEGEAAVAGIVTGLPQAQGVLGGSIVSGLRMLPGNWAGAHTCWGTENREAAVRFLPATEGNPRGAHVEVKIVDPSANPYLATAAILGLALDGIEEAAALPPEVTVDPAALTASERIVAGAALLPTDQADVIAALTNSPRMRAILGDPAVDALVAVRRYEYEHYSSLEPERLCDRFRMAWSV
ncbi:MAG TPA: glutamine synthetase family protein [Mycobacterium sp.]|nr:glutamine synthetase family protein [Mycobacterium sp.]HQE14334.1 glutamine synthetase family protein [Mycobacterium sp.]